MKRLKILQFWCFVTWISILSTGIILLGYITKTRILKLPSQLKFESSNIRKLPTVKGGKVEDQWVAVEGAALYYFSAYIEKDKVTLITIAEKIETQYNITCRFFNVDGTLLHARSDGALYYIPEDHEKRYTAAFVHCKMPYGIKAYAVALVTSKFELPLFYVPMRHVNRQKKFGVFTVCICPLRLDYDEGGEFVEMIELNRILGADHFIVYNYNSSSAINSLLNFYEEQGLVDVVSWHLPLQMEANENSFLSDIHYFGQLAAINDCVFRSKGTSRFVVNQDIDEFIIPRKHENWLEMIRSFPPRFNSYMFRSTFFRRDWPDVNESYLLPEDAFLAKHYKSFTILKQTREDEIFRKKIRTKYIVNPTCVKVAGIHEVFNYTRGILNCKTYITTRSIALVHHYRYVEEKGDVPKTIDSSIMTYKDKLLHRLQNVWTKLNSVRNTTKRTVKD